jgi:hypothetical protein
MADQRQAQGDDESPTQRAKPKTGKPKSVKPPAPHVVEQIRKLTAARRADGKRPA